MVKKPSKLIKEEEKARFLIKRERMRSYLEESSKIISWVNSKQQELNILDDDIIEIGNESFTIGEIKKTFAEICHITKPD